MSLPHAPPRLSDSVHCGHVMVAMASLGQGHDTLETVDILLFAND